MSARFQIKMQARGGCLRGEKAERLVERVCDWFRAYGVPEIIPFSSVYEDVVFRLPVELRRAETPAA